MRLAIYLFIYKLNKSQENKSGKIFRKIQYILTIKPIKCTNFPNLFLEKNSTCFGHFLCPSSGVLHCTHSNGPEDGQTNCPKHVEFFPKINLRN